MANFFMETSTRTELTGESHAENNWKLTNAVSSVQIVILDHKDDKFRLEMYRDGKISLKTVEPMKTSHMISVGRNGKVLANMVIEQTTEHGSIIRVNDLYQFSKELIMHLPVMWGMETIEKSAFIHIELNADHASIGRHHELARLDISIDQCRFMTMYFTKDMLAHCCFDGAGVDKSLEVFHNKLVERNM